MVKQQTQMLVKKGEIITTQLKRILYATDQWMASLSHTAAQAVNLSQEIIKFCRKDAILQFSGKKFHDQMLAFEHQAYYVNAVTTKEFAGPIKDYLQKFSGHSKKAKEWLIGSKTERQHADAMNEWVEGRYAFFSSAFANLISIQEQYMSNALTIFSSVVSSFSSEQAISAFNKPIEEVSNSLDGILQHAVAIEYFKKFLDQECSTENLNFILDADCFMARHQNGASNDDDFVDHANRIFTRYIKVNSECQVNIPSTITKDIESKVKMLSVVQVLQPPGGSRDATIFNEARQNCAILLEHDSLSRFRRSPLFQELKAAWKSHMPRLPVSPTPLRHSETTNNIAATTATTNNTAAPSNDTATTSNHAPPSGQATGNTPSSQPKPLSAYSAPVMPPRGRVDVLTPLKNPFHFSKPTAPPTNVPAVGLREKRSMSMPMENSAVFYVEGGSKLDVTSSKINILSRSPSTESFGEQEMSRTASDMSISGVSDDGYT